MATTALYVAAVVGVLAAGASAYATYSASEAQSNQLNYQAKVQKINAQNAANQAAIAAQNAHERDQKILAAQRARMGATGVISSEGSELLVQMDSAEQAALEEARIRYGGDVQSQGFVNDARIRSYAARTTREQGYVSSGASLLGGTASAVGNYYGNTRGRTTT